MIKKKSDKKIVDAGFVAQLGAVVLLCVYPLFVKNKYFGITHAKMLFFCITAFALMVACNLVMLSTNDKLSPKLWAIKKKPEIALLCFGGFAVISCIIAKDSVAALTGEDGRNMGLITVFAEICAFLVISRYFRSSRIVWYLFAAACVLINLFSFIQLVGVDLFGFFKGLSGWTKNNFTSTLGNINVFSSFICLALPFFIYMSAKAEKTADKVVYNVALFFCFIGSYSSRSDSFLLGFGAAIIILLFLLRKDFSSQKTFVHSGLLYFVAGAIISVLFRVIKIKGSEFNYLTWLIITPKVIAGGLSFFAVLYVVLMLFPKLEKATGIVFTVLAFGGIAAFMLQALLLIYFSFINTTADIGAFSKYFRFSDTWGSSRGLIWKTVAGIYKDYPFINKLFGCGEDCLNSVIKEVYGNTVTIDNGRIVDNAHNEYLHYLATHGLMGLLSYLCFIFFVFRENIKSSEPFRVAALCGAFSYLAQAFVNLCQPLTTPLIFVFLALACADNSIMSAVYSGTKELLNTEKTEN